MGKSTYLYGYNGSRASLATMETRTAWNRIDPEMRRRAIAMMDACPYDLGFGNGFRSYASQKALFLSRYYVSPRGSVYWNGQRWAKKEGVASAAPPGLSFHEETTPANYCLAIDFLNYMPAIGWMNTHCGAYGLKHFAKVNNERWHVQPVEVPNSKREYDPARHFLSTWDLGPAPDNPTPPNNLITTAPPPTLRKGTNDPPRVRWLQQILNERFGTTLTVDGLFGTSTENGVKRMQGVLRSTADGIYGTATAAKLATWLSEH